jgi:DNA replication ATP-dependent helicase Dna2
MSLSNRLIYGGRLSCGNEKVANRTLQLPEHDGLASVHEHAYALCGFKKNECWLANATSPESKVILLNTDPLGQAANEYLDGGTKNITNPAEASLCLEAMLALFAQGVKPRDIGIITPYRSQVALLRRLLRSITPADTAATPLRIASITDVEVDTPDRYQGRDKEVIIISLVRSNTRGDVGELLRDSRRVNVALTRARSKLILVGSRSTLQNGSDLLSGIVSIINEAHFSGEGMCMLNLPKNALEGHAGLGSCASQQPLALAKEICSPTTKKRKVSSPEMTASKRHHGIASDPPSANVDRSLTEDSPSRAIGGHKKGPKIITRHAGQLGGKMKKMKEAVAIEIWEDLIGEDDELDDF